MPLFQPTSLVSRYEGDVGLRFHEAPAELSALNHFIFVFRCCCFVASFYVVRATCSWNTGGMSSIIYLWKFFVGSASRFASRNCCWAS